MTGIAGVLEKRYNVGPVKPWVQDAADFLGSRHGIKTIGGWRRTDQFPDHPGGYAIDIMVPNKQTGDAVAQDAINNAAALGLLEPKSYLIWNHRVWNSKQGWHPYTSTSNPHTDHVHISLWHPGTGVPGGSVPTSSDLSGDTEAISTVDATCAWSVKFPVAGQSCLATHVQLRSMLSIAITGTSVVIGIVGVILLVGYGAMRSKTVREVAGAAKFL